MTKHWVLHLSLDQVQVHEILEPFIIFYNLVGTEDDILIGLAMFLHYPGIIGLSPGDITSPGMTEQHGDCFRVQPLWNTAQDIHNLVI